MYYNSKYLFSPAQVCTPVVACGPTRLGSGPTGHPCPWLEWGAGGNQKHGQLRRRSATLNHHLQAAELSPRSDLAQPFSTSTPLHIVNKQHLFHQRLCLLGQIVHHQALQHNGNFCPSPSNIADPLAASTKPSPTKHYLLCDCARGPRLRSRKRSYLTQGPALLRFQIWSGGRITRMEAQRNTLEEC